MDQTPQQPAGSPNTADNRADTRAWVGYTVRPTGYISTARPTQPHNTQVSMSESAEAAQRIVAPQLQPALAQNPAPTPLPQPSPNIQPVSFDMLPPKPIVQAPQPPQPTASPLPVNTNNVVPIIPETKTTTLPTDLPPNFASISDAPPSLKKHGKLNFQLPDMTKPKLAISAAVMVIAVGALTGVSVLRSRSSSSLSQDVKAAITGNKQDSDGGMTEGVPHENGNPPSVDYYRTAASYPRVIRIPKINTEARVLALNIAPTGALKAPATIFDAGWYKDSSKPGEQGAMVIDGHASGPTKPGIFKNLGALTKDDKIEIERGDGQKYTYTVTLTKVYEAENLDMSSVMVSSIPTKPGLSLITCGGKFDAATNKYEQRTVVYAVLN